MSITVTIPIQDNSISMSEMDYLCKQSLLIEFTEKCSSYNYSQVFQIHAELQNRAGRIQHQLEERGEYDQQWSIKAKSAHSIMRHKIGIAAGRLNAIRDNHISILMRDIGGSGWIAGKRLVMIKCLIHMIDHYSNITSFSQEEKSVLDACRKAADLDDVPKFDRGFTYNPVTKSISNEEGSEIAKITQSGYMEDEIGYLLTLSPVMSNLLARSESMLEYLITKHPCISEGNGHEISKCVHCSSEKLHDAIIDVLTEIK